MAVFVVLLFLTIPFISHSNDLVHNINNNILMRNFCGRNPPINRDNFMRHRNATLIELRNQLLTKKVRYARAESLNLGDSVFAAFQCRNYLSIDQCDACFDDAVSEIVSCTYGNGAFVVFDNCFLRYEDYGDFYDRPNLIEDGTDTPILLCGNQSVSTQQTNFNQVVNGLLLDLRYGTPKTRDFYTASTTKLSENITVYGIAQCAGNISQTICQGCLDTAYNKLYRCTSNTQGRFFDLGCFMRYSTTRFFNGNQTTDISRGHSIKISMIVGTIGGVALFSIILLLWLLYQLQKKIKKTYQQACLTGAVHFSYSDLQLATNNFSEANVLGRGGFGEVFKTILDDKSIVAVKKLQVRHARAKEYFENEVKLISNIRHRNLLRLLGWSSEGSDLLLVLEYMPNGSLDSFLWGVERGTLDWNQRYEIIFGIARGLAHLHNESHVKIIHRDIKSSNILLSDDFKPKIGDFGLARFQPEDRSHVSTKFVGTLGYTAPEYALQGILSDKVDTYSFGVVILEIISGRRSTEVNPDMSTDYLLEHAWKLYEKNAHMKFVDVTLDLNEQERQHVTNIIEVALLCTQSPVSNRPTMSEVVLMLQDHQSLGNRQLTRPFFVKNYDRRVRIGFSNNYIAVSDFKKPKADVRYEKADEKVNG